jgi:DNA-binding transcriptional regulator YhcF (GntR family)
MPENREQYLKDIQSILKEGPLSIREIAKKVDIDWRTANSNLNILKQFNIFHTESKKNANLFYLKQPDHLFQLPIKDSDEHFIKAIYAKITEFCKEMYDQIPTKTQANKVLYRFVQDEKLKLPIGWYQFGPCCVLPYDCYSEQYDFTETQKRKLREITREYCQHDNFELQRKVYKEEKNPLYLAKEEFVKGEFKDKKEAYSIFKNIIFHSPDESQEVLSFFISTLALNIHDKDILAMFKDVWKYNTTIIYKTDLKIKYYNRNIDPYFKHLDHFKKEIINTLSLLGKKYLKQVRK